MYCTSTVNVVQRREPTRTPLETHVALGDDHLDDVERDVPLVRDVDALAADVRPHEHVAVVSVHEDEARVP